MSVSYTLIGAITAIIGYHIHQSVFFTIMDFLFWGIVWIKWLIFHEVTLSIIKSAFAWFFV